MTCRAVATALVGAGLVAAAPSTAHASGITPPTVAMVSEQMHFGYEHQCADVAGASGEDRAAIWLWTCVPGVKNQQWRLYQEGVDDKGPFFSIRSAHTGFTKCMDVLDRSTYSGARVVQYGCWPSAANQHWYVTPLGQGVNVFRARHSRLPLCLTAGLPQGMDSLTVEGCYLFADPPDEQKWRLPVQVS